MKFEIPTLRTFWKTCTCLIALAVFCGCAQASSGADDYKILAQDESWDLRDDGYVLTVKAVDSQNVWLSLLKYGREVDSDVLDSGDVYYYEPGTGEKPVIKTVVEIIKRDGNYVVKLTDIYLRVGTPSKAKPTGYGIQSLATIDYLRITAEVNNGYAVTTVEEKLTNSHDTATDDEFRFLIPDLAFISGFSLFIDGIEYKADVLPRKEAQERFDEAVSRGRTAGILKTKKKNIFSYSLSFAPHQSIVVRLTYDQPVKKVLGEYEYVISLRETDVAHIVPNLSVNITVTSVDKIASLKTHGFEGTSVKYLSSTKSRVTYSAKALPGKDLTVVFTTDNPELNGEMLFYESSRQGYLMHVFSPSEEDLGTTALGKEIIFVIDKSGSMKGNKIAQVKMVFTDIIADLPPDDYFNVIFFDSTVWKFKKTLMEANTQTKADAANFVAALGSNGGTNINDALLDALAMFEPDTERVPIIVFLTDGKPTNGVKSPYVIRENVKAANDAEVSIFVIAFGIDDEENYDFLRAMSLENCGVAERFYPGVDAETEIGTFYKTISTPVITDMKFDYSDVSDIVNTGYNTLFAGSDEIILARYPAGTNSIDSIIDAVTRTGSRRFDETFSVVSVPENSFIPRLFAYTTIRRLMDRTIVEGETDALVSEITEISIEFGFVTPYTSLFVEVPTIDKSETITTASDVDGGVESVYAASDESVVYVPSADGGAMGTIGREEAPAAESKSPPGHIMGGGEKTGDAVHNNWEKVPTQGFGAVFAIVGLTVIAYLLRRRKCFL